MQTQNIDQPYKHQEFPKMVYKGSNLNDWLVINSEEERPEGYVDYDDAVTGGVNEVQADAAAGAVQAAEAAASRKAAEDAAAAKEAAAAAEAAKEAASAEEKRVIDEERDRIKAKLTEHSVEFKPQLGLEKLKELEALLDQHLAAKAAEAAAGSDTVNGGAAS